MIGALAVRVINLDRRWRSRPEHLTVILVYLLPSVQVFSRVTVTETGELKVGLFFHKKDKGFEVEFPGYLPWDKIPEEIVVPVRSLRVGVGAPTGDFRNRVSLILAEMLDEIGFFSIIGGDKGVKISFSLGDEEISSIIISYEDFPLGFLGIEL